MHDNHQSDTIMKIPENIELYEGELATFWFDASGILCAYAKPVERSLEKQINNYEFIRHISGNKKVCLLANATSSKFIDDATRKYIQDEMPKLFKAMAVVSDSAFGKVNTVIFKNLNADTIPIELFAEEAEAIEWLKQYL